MDGDFYFDYHCFGSARAGGLRLTRKGTSAFPSAYKIDVLDDSNWMSYITDDTRLQDLIIPGSYDALTYGVDATLSICTDIAKSLIPHHVAFR